MFVYPSHNDKSPLVVMEALASGLYALAGDYLMGNFYNFEGEYLEYLPMNSESFAIAFILLANDPSIVNHDKGALHKYVKENYGWGIVSEKFYAHRGKFYESSRRDLA